MRRALSKSFLSIVVCLAFLTSVMAMPAEAQGSVDTPTPTTGVVQLSNPNVVTFSQLQEKNTGDIILNGPYESAGIGFALPANWGLEAGTQLDLIYGVSFNADVQSSSDIILLGGGTLSVLLNDVLLTTIQLKNLGEVETRISIPLAAFEETRSDEFNVLSFVLESAESCRLFGQNTTVYIHPTSFLTLPHEIVRPSTDLVNFPRPIFQNSFLLDSALMVVPDQPSASELQAALVTAAGMSKLSSNELELEIITLSQFRNEDARNSHLIVVGKAASFPFLEGLHLPLPVRAGQFQINDSTNDGLLQMIVSPWSNSHVILVVSANTDQGVVKAAQAVTTGVIRSNSSENLAVIEKVNFDLASDSQAMDRTLADLGYVHRTFDDRGFNAGYYDFYIPVGTNISPESYFEMVYGHSALIDYDSSQIVVILNNQPIGSVRMSDASAELPTNKVKIMIPPSVVRPGENYLVVQVYLVPIDECAPPDIQGLWVNIWSESTLHIPQLAAPASPFSIQRLSEFPEPLIYSPILDSTAFVLERNDVKAWQSALRVAEFLGWQSSGPVVALSVFYDDELPMTERSKYNLLVIGKPSQMSIVSEVNDYLPAPFSIGSDNASEDNSFQVIYQIPVDSPRGYLEIIQSPWNPNNILLTILGNTDQGVSWAASALTGAMRWQLAGNFAVVDDQQVFTTDTISNYRSVGNDSTPVPDVEIVPTNANISPLLPSSPPTNQQDWVTSVLFVTVALIVLILAYVIIRNWLRNRIHRKGE